MSDYVRYTNATQVKGPCVISLEVPLVLVGGEDITRLEPPIFSEYPRAGGLVVIEEMLSSLAKSSPGSPTPPSVSPSRMILACRPDTRRPNELWIGLYPGI